MDIGNLIGLIMLVAVLCLSWRRYRRYQQQQQQKLIAEYRFHPAIMRKVQQRYPHLDAGDLVMVEEALRDYFRMCLRGGRQAVAMPSQVVDVAWHEFILFTRAYQAFCQQALKRFLHHTPTEAMLSRRTAQGAIKRAWRLACAIQNQHPAISTPMPLIFAIDERLNIEDGFRYYPNCDQRPGNDGYCTSHIGCSSGCSGDSWHNDNDRGNSWWNNDSSSDGGDSGGCGGD